MGIGGTAVSWIVSGERTWISMSKEIMAVRWRLMHNWKEVLPSSTFASLDSCE